MLTITYREGHRDWCLFGTGTVIEEGWCPRQESNLHHPI